MSRLGNGLGDSVALSLTYFAQYTVNTQPFVITQTDKAILRELALRVAELAARPIEAEKKKLWYSHNELKPTRPLVFCDPENGWYEIISGDQLKCEGTLARIWEFKLRKEIFWGESMGDDRVVVPYFTVQYVFALQSRGLEHSVIGGENDGAYTWEPALKNYEDIDKLRFSQFDVDNAKTDYLFNLASETLGDILPVRLEGCWWWTLGMTWDVISLIGLEKFMLDFYEHPDELHRLMAFLRDENLAKLDFLEKNNLLTLNNKDTYIGSGGFGWTSELPQKDYDPKSVRTIDIWGFAESQETVAVSPQMFEEFVFPYQLPLLEKFGLNAYGCCEPLDKRWYIIKKIPRLRRVSVSNWANEESIAEQMRGDYIYSRKPPSASLACPNIDEAAVREGLKNTVNIARRNGCRLEFVMKDNHTIGRNPQNVINWCKIAREEAELY